MLWALGFLQGNFVRPEIDFGAVRVFSGQVFTQVRPKSAFFCYNLQVLF
jgi:hypothetical protein